MAAASRAVSTSGSMASALVDEPARSSGTEGEAGGWSPGSGVGGHCCSWARGALAGRRRSALPSVAGVGPYLDPEPRCDVFLLVGGVIAQLVASETKEERTPGSAGELRVIEELAEPAVFNGQDREHAAVVPGDGTWVGAVTGKMRVRT
jgi:hypothetical protein